MRLPGSRQERAPDMGERSGGSGIETGGKLALRSGPGTRQERAAEGGVPARGWSQLRLVADRVRHGPRARVRLISCRPADPVSRSFDLLRTRLLHALQDNGWHRVAVTAPAPRCGSTFVAANLALSLSRLQSVRTLLMDLNLPDPGLARAFDIGNVGPLTPMLTGRAAPDEHLFRIGPNLALGLNDRPDDDAAALLQHPGTRQVLDALNDALRPDVTLYDLPPMLDSDEVEAFLPQVDGVLLVTDGTRTIGRQITECERLLQGRTPLLGVVLNRADTGRTRQ